METVDTPDTVRVDQVAAAPVKRSAADDGESARQNKLREAAVKLQVDGYCVLPGFLDTHLIEALLADYAGQGASSNRNYSIGIASPDAIDLLWPTIEELSRALLQQSDITTSLEGLHQAYYFDTQELVFNNWHQDAESHYMLGTHRDYVNLYIPLKKPIAEKSNLQVIPASRLRKEAPGLWHKFEYGGGTICTRRDDGSTWVHDESGMRAELDFDIDELKDTPHLNAGDLLLMRGDTFHRTQDADTARIAISLRMTNPDLQISLRDLVTGSSKKMGLMAGNWDEFGPLVNYLRRCPGQTASWRAVRAQLQPASGREQRPKSNDRKAAMRQLLALKLRYGLLVDTAIRERRYRQVKSRIKAT